MKWVIVTGASKGLGLEITRQIINQTEYGVIGISRSNPNISLNNNEKYKHINYDLENVRDIKKLYFNEIKNIGVIHGLVNNGAMAYDDLITNLDIESLETMFKVNVFSSMHLTKYVIRDMLFHKTKGTIINVSSISTHTGYKGLSMYAATKGALEALGKNLAREWGSKGIRVNTVVPGFMETGMSESLTSEQKHRIYKRTSLKKETDIGSVASMVTYLLTESAKSVTGTTIRVDNGTL